MPKGVRFSKEEVKNLILIEGNGEYELCSEYNGSNKKLHLKHLKCNKEFDMTFSCFHLYHQRCPYCYRRNKRLSNEQVDNMISTKLGEDYIRVSEYFGFKERIMIYHKSCGYKYETSLEQIQAGQVCPNCRINPKKISSDQYIEMANKRSDFDEYEILDEYKDMHTCMRFRHKLCGKTFSLWPKSFLDGAKCKCQHKKKSNFPREYYLNIFNENIKERMSHLVLLDIDQSGHSTVFKVRCLDCCKVSSIRIDHFISGQDCSCHFKNKKLSEDKIKELFKSVANSCEYEFIRVIANKKKNDAHRCVEYKYLGDNSIHVISVSDLIRRPLYSPQNISLGEQQIHKFLKSRGIEYRTEFSFKDCKNVGCLYFDFYIPSKNICIEFDGVQHYIAVEYWGGEEGLKARQENDMIKNRYCQENNIKLIRISYKELPNIDAILTEELDL